ncbi:MAG: hypothetical protein CL910_01475 [Deltaproteobacteria bacterium]|jgi:hypothetical protein|nr:hypothetical protein [Deltaproteobacteria bacterium]
MRLEESGMQRRVILLGSVLSFLAIAPAVRAVPIVMTPDPVGNWTCDAGHCGASSMPRDLQITLVSGDTSPVPTIVLRLSLTDGGPSSNATVSFSFDFDVNATSASLVGTTGTFLTSPTVFSLFDPLVTYSCSTGPCTVDVQFQFASTPAYGDFRDTVNQFVDSPGAPNQTLRGNFSVPEPGLALLLCVTLALASRRPRST